VGVCACLCLWCAVCGALWQVLRCVVLCACLGALQVHFIEVRFGAVWCCFVYKNQQLSAFLKCNKLYADYIWIISGLYYVLSNPSPAGLCR